MTNTTLVEVPPPNAVDLKDRVPLVEIRNGKLIFKQKALFFEKMSETMQEIVQFRQMLEQRIERKAPSLSAIPDEHKPLIAKLIHESDKGLQGLTKHVQQELLPVRDDDGADVIAAALPHEVVEKAIKSIAVRHDYGLEDDSVGGRIPAAWHIWRWEVKDEYRDWLPRSAKEKSESRVAERRRAKEDLKALFRSLSADERAAILGTKKTATAAKGKSSSKQLAESSVRIGDSEGRPGSQQTDHNAGDESDRQPGTSTAANKNRPKKTPDQDRAIKEKEKQEKKLAKAEKEKKELEAQSKSRSLFANFFGKAKSSRASPSNAGPAVPGSSSAQSEFEKTFKPFSLKKDAELAPINWFHHGGKRKRHLHSDNVIIIDDEEDEGRNNKVGPSAAQDISMESASSSAELGQMTAQERLQDVLSSVSSSLPRHSAHRSCRAPLKTHHPYSVRGILSQLNEAEISGDDSLVRSILSLLRDRNRIPAKLLIFTEDARPGYFGTWTRSSHEIGPRTPFARDVVALDYNYDSGEDWEEESGDADDVMDDVEDEEVGEEPDSDLDSWLVDDDDVDPGTPIEERAGSPGMFPADLVASAPKRKANEGNMAKASKKRKVVVPLVPFVKGPCWEPAIGKCEYEPLKPYRIELFNDTPFPIDPFIFISEPVDSTIPAAKDSYPSDSGFLIPPLPSHLVDADGSSSSAPAAPSVPKRAPLAPKTTFPDAHLPLLFSKIITLETGNITAIVETVYQELRAHKVKKNAIEAKVREVGEKSKEKKIWTIRPDVKALHGLV